MDGIATRIRIKFSDFVNKSIDWFGKDNLYGKDIKFFGSNISEMDVDPESLADWNQFWKDRERQSEQQKLEFVGSDDSRVEQHHVLVTETEIGFRPLETSK